MLVECGLVRATLDDGREFTFRPSFGRIAALADPEGIVRLFGRLHAPGAENAAAEVLIGLCDEPDPSPVVGEPMPTAAGVRWVGGAIAPAERVILARHLMTHGIVGTAKPGTPSSGRYSTRFDAAEYVAAARAHLGMSADDAEALSMTEFQRLFAMKFPDPKAERERNVPTREEYDAAMRRLKERNGGN